jgi:hypothetical protein
MWPTIPYLHSLLPAKKAQFTVGSPRAIIYNPIHQAAGPDAVRCWCLLESR